MAQINQDSILFTKVRTGGLPVITGIYIPGFNGVDPDDGGLINAVDIDWNEAHLDNDLVINTTGEMLSRLNDTYTKSELNESLDTISLALTTSVESLSDRINALDFYTKEESDERYMLKSETSEEYVSKSYVDEKVLELQTQLSQLASNINWIIDQINNSQSDDAYYIYCGNATGELPQTIDATNGTKIDNLSDLQQIRIYQSNPSDEDIYWYFTLPNIYEYQLWDDNLQFDLTSMFDVIDNNYLDKYIVYKSATKERTLSLIAKKIQ